MKLSDEGSPIHADRPVAMRERNPGRSINYRAGAEESVRSAPGVIQITPRRGAVCYAFSGVKRVLGIEATDETPRVYHASRRHSGLAAACARGDRVRRIGVVEAFTENDSEGQARIGSLRESLAKLGWTNGRNVRIEYRWGAIDPNRARAYAAELAAMAPDVIFVDSAPVVAAIRDQIHAIPIVFIQAGDPVQANSVQSFARPGGNLTGFLQYEPTIAGKYLQLLKDIAPSVARVAVMQFENSTWRGDFSAIQAVAPSFAVMPISTIVHNAEDIEQAIIALAQEPNGGLIALQDTNIALHRDLIIALAARHSLPAVYSSRPYAAGGGLMSYGVDNIDLYGRAASYVDRILKGEKPSDLPVQAPTKFELVINLKTAKALGLNVSPTLQIAADEVIE